MIWNWLRRARPAPVATPNDTAPRTYAQWSSWLDRLGHGDDDVHCLEQLRQGQLSWTSGVAPLFLQRLGDEIQRRLRECQDRMNRNLRLGGTDETLVVRALLQTRSELAFLHQLCQLPALPEATRQQLSDGLHKFAELSQQSLLDSAQADRSGRLASLLHHNPLTRYTTVSGAATDPVSPTAAPADGPPRRRTILS